MDEMGESAFLDILSPTLIKNTKTQFETDEKEHAYIQLEGAMGSVLLNLDRYWREHFNEPLVYLINVEVEQRTQFFSPLKSAFDFLMQFHSDRFVFDAAEMRVKNRSKFGPPLIDLKGSEDDPSFYSHLHNVMRSFLGVRIVDLTELRVTGKILATQVELRGSVEVHHEGEGVLDLSQINDPLITEEAGLKVFENLKVLSSADGVHLSQIK